MSSLQVFHNMIGRVMAQIEGGSVDSGRMTFHAEDGSKFTFYHSRDCCEDVRIVQVDGDIGDLMGIPLVQAEVVSSEGEPAPDSPQGSFTWTFYKFGTAKGVS